MPRILGIDFGDRRIGVAISDELGLTAQPRGVLLVEKDGGHLDEMARLCREQGVERVVVGLPRNMDGSLGPRARLTLEFVKVLAARLQLPVETWDERLTTRQAERALWDRGLTHKRRKARRDVVSAQLILQGYLDAGKHQTRPT
jgi:putative Holliday junction resolvase